MMCTMSDLDLEHARQPVCPRCAVVMHALRGGDECRVCGYRVEWPRTRKPVDDPSIIDF